jgi:hypothetical protein
MELDQVVDNLTLIIIEGSYRTFTERMRPDEMQPLADETLLVIPEEYLATKPTEAFAPMRSLQKAVVRAGHGIATPM